VNQVAESVDVLTEMGYGENLVWDTGAWLNVPYSFPLEEATYFFPTKEVAMRFVENFKQFATVTREPISGTWEQAQSSAASRGNRAKLSDEFGNEIR
jgi:hypothetical protein